MLRRKLPLCVILATGLLLPVFAQKETLVRVDLAYRVPGTGPTPDFSPYGTQVKLHELPADASLPPGAARPARNGTIAVGPDEKSQFRVLVTSDPAHPGDLCRLYVDANRNGNFADDGPPATAEPKQNEKTKGWWSSFDKVEVPIPYGNSNE